jgi:threonine synthase
VTVGCARKLYKQGRITPDETTVLCITGNGLKTTDALAGEYEAEEAISPKLAEFNRYLERALDVPEAVGV